MDADGIELRELPPPPRRRNDLPEWEVRYYGKVIGRIAATRLSGARNTFYFAWGVHPDNGREYRLEGNIDLDERVDVITRFHLDPSEFSQHLGI